jgi:hypothetical protein
VERVLPALAFATRAAADAFAPETLLCVEARVFWGLPVVRLDPVDFALALDFEGLLVLLLREVREVLLAGIITSRAATARKRCVVARLAVSST